VSSPSRRDFLRSAAALSAGALARGKIPHAIARARAIAPMPGTTWEDAEHVVVLMQENRSFDHMFGALQGVRGFRDPRVHMQPDGRPVWFQTDAHGATYPPFRLDITNTDATWIGGLPHNWLDQVDARNGGRYDRWLIAKPKKDLPSFTLGHYGRDDLPFYYALADAFTVCDQAFCSSLAGTTPNRLHLWTGTIRRDASDFPRVENSDTDYDRQASWTTFPERLQDAGVSWRIYQNEINIDSGLDDDHNAWLANFSDNPIEWFSQYRVRFGTSRRAWLPQLIDQLPDRIAAAEAAARASGLTPKEAAKRQRTVVDLTQALVDARAERAQYNDAAWAALPARDRALHERAFTTNRNDPAYRSLATLRYQDGAVARDVQVPAGDALRQFRDDVHGGALPAVSWLVAPENFSDHPSAPWYGAWYVSQVLDILTRNPAVWQKTILVLCYDENDGYFDHVPPFTAPHPHRPATGRATDGIDTTVDWANAHGRESAIGLGYRVPMVIASPWSRGGCVNSQVSDHTSVLQLMERWLAAKGTPVRETNISDWRRVVCGDLTSVFRSSAQAASALPAPLARDATVERIHAAQFRGPPPGPHTATGGVDVAAMQEPGTRPSCPLPYELHVNAARTGGDLVLTMEARTAAFGERSSGAPFNAYSYGKEMTCRAYAVQAGKDLSDTWPSVGRYHVRVDGPNGFVREFVGVGDAEELHASLDFRSGSGASGDIAVQLVNPGAKARMVTILDASYGAARQHLRIPAGDSAAAMIHTAGSHGWYDIVVQCVHQRYRYAGRIETGDWSVTDPAMGREHRASA
jgi:phospholipase C